MPRTTKGKTGAQQGAPGKKAAAADQRARVRALEKELKSCREELEGLRASGKTGAEGPAGIQGGNLQGMSHTLRTPLNAIIGFSHVLLTGMAGPLNGEQREYLTDIYTSGTKLLDSVNEMLDAERPRKA